MIKSSFFVLAFTIVLTCSATGQSKYFTREGKAQFHSKAPMEEIVGVNKKVTSIVDISGGQMEFSVLIKAFEFEKALMQEHFNENYMESDKFPKATFKGQITNNADIKWTVDGSYTAKVTGKMSIHGVTKDFTGEGKIQVKAGKISASSTFNILLADYEIKIPSVVKDKISESVKVEIELNYDPYTTSK
jgi:polyisoprenoid-binding protein YceI